MAVRSAVSALVLAALVLVAAMIFRGELTRSYYLSKICGPDSPDALTYLAHHLDDPKVLAGATRALDAAPQECFDHAVAAFSSMGRWGSWFGTAWVRYLTDRAGRGEPLQRASIAAEIGRMLWLHKPGSEDPRLTRAVERLLVDTDAGVRLNALSAAACVPRRRMEWLGAAMNDQSTVVAGRAQRLRSVVQEGFHGAPRRTLRSGLADGEHPPPEFHELLELESSATASKVVPIAADAPELIRIHSVRVSTAAHPEDLLPAMDSPHASIRDLACLAALERFGTPGRRELVLKLLASLNDQQQSSGAILAGLAGLSDPEVLGRIRQRAGSTRSWVVQQHCYLGLWLLEQDVGAFDPLVLMRHRDMPKTTLIMVLLHAGRLEGLDWLLNPFGEPPAGGVEGLVLLLGRYRYDGVLRWYIPGWPELPVWGGEAQQRDAVQRARDWYLVNRGAVALQNDE